MKSFIDQIIKNLEANGFPEKRVSLPTDKMFEIADNKGFGFTAVMDELKANYQIDSVIEDEKIVFTKINTLNEYEQQFAGMDQADMMQKAQEMMANMDPAELQRMKEMFMNMSDQEKADIMKKGKEMGII